jgi:hypothetical protein
MEQRTFNILHVDDNPITSQRARALIEIAGIKSIYLSATNPLELKAHLENPELTSLDLLVSSYPLASFKELKEFGALNEVRKNYPNVPALFLFPRLKLEDLEGIELKDNTYCLLQEDMIRRFVPKVYRLLKSNS